MSNKCFVCVGMGAGWGTTTVQFALSKSSYFISGNCFSYLLLCPQIFYLFMVRGLIVSILNSVQVNFSMTKQWKNVAYL